jgi:hypothetical protein
MAATASSASVPAAISPACAANSPDVAARNRVNSCSIWSGLSVSAPSRRAAAPYTATARSLGSAAAVTMAAQPPRLCPTTAIRDGST